MSDSKSASSDSIRERGRSVACWALSSVRAEVLSPSRRSLRTRCQHECTRSQTARAACGEMHGLRTDVRSVTSRTTGWEGGGGKQKLGWAGRGPNCCFVHLVAFALSSMPRSARNSALTSTRPSFAVTGVVRWCSSNSRCMRSKTVSPRALQYLWRAHRAVCTWQTPQCEHCNVSYNLWRKRPPGNFSNAFLITVLPRPVSSVIPA